MASVGNSTTEKEATSQTEEWGLTSKGHFPAHIRSCSQRTGLRTETTTISFSDDQPGNQNEVESPSGATAAHPGLERVGLWGPGAVRAASQAVTQPGSTTISGA